MPTATVDEQTIDTETGEVLRTTLTANGRTVDLDSPEAESLTREVVADVVATARNRTTGKSESGHDRVQIPDDDTFDEAGYIWDDELRAFGERVREQYAGELEQAGRVLWRWKRKGGTYQGNALGGKCVKLSGPAQHFARADYLIWFAADHLRDMHVTVAEMEAMIYHECCHIEREIDEDTLVEKLGIRGHDFQGFLSELARFGAHSGELRAMRSEVEQMRLPGVTS